MATLESARVAVLSRGLASAAALGLCTWYHIRMLERKRLAKQYQAVPGEDLELGEGVGPQEEGVASNLEAQVDGWDEKDNERYQEARDEAEKTHSPFGMLATDEVFLAVFPLIFSPRGPMKYRSREL